MTDLHRQRACRSVSWRSFYIPSCATVTMQPVYKSHMLTHYYYYILHTYTLLLSLPYHQYSLYSSNVASLNPAIRVYCTLNLNYPTPDVRDIIFNSPLSRMNYPTFILSLSLSLIFHCPNSYTLV